MGLTTLDATPDNFATAFDKINDKENSEKITLILFLANKDPSTNRSWCPDCVRAEPVIYDTLEKLDKDVVLLRGFAGDRPTWRNPSHPWRLDDRFKLKGLPTLTHWKDGAISGRLEDHEAHIQSRINSLFE